MQSELKTLQHTVGITFIYVTHDQEEAITLSNRIAVMNAGRLEQEGTPTEVYERPQTRFVADFIGLTNFIAGTVHESYSDRSSDASSKQVAVSTSIGEIICGGQQPHVTSGERVTLTLRPEKLQVLAPDTPPPDDWNVVEGVITQATFLGAQNEYRVHVGGISGSQEIIVRQQNMGTLTDVKVLDDQDVGLYQGWHVFGPGERVNLVWRHEASLVLRESSAEAEQKGSAGGQVPDPHASVV
jgi:ABC-type Fe3+/spermidine/putrescine transport system ATPase subunit